MLEIITSDQPEKWDAAVDAIPDSDVYYRLQYLRAFELHGDGKPSLMSFTHDGVKGVCAMMLRDVADDSRFKDKIDKGEYFDMTTPYGYGGFIFNQTPDSQTIAILKGELIKVMSEKGVISAFFRFHPVLKNTDYHRELLEVIDLGKTIAIDLESPDVIWTNIISKNRNMIRKAEKSGIEIKMGTGMELLDKFTEIYNETMRHDNAEEYYYFKRPFYESIDKDLAGRYHVAYAELDGKPIAMSIMIYDGQRLNYHLSGSRYEFRNLAPSNLLLYKTALWGCEHGYKTFHLGGGVGSGEDNLYKFKAAFNRNSDYHFAIGRLIIDQE